MKTAARAVLGFAAVAGAAVHKKDGVHIEPELDPKSHKKFFDEDNPSDVSHRTDLDVDHPYPVVQTSADYDKDYTKDENSNKMDAKMWDYQLKHAKELSDAAAEVERLKAQVAKAEDAEKAAEDHEGEEKKELSEAEAKVVTEKAVKEGTVGAEAPLEQKDVEGAAGKVDTEVKDLEGCKKELEAAKERLAKLQEEANEAEAVAKKEEALKLAAVDAEKAAEKVEKDSQEEAEVEKKELDAAKQHHEEEKAELDGMQDELKQAESKLKNFRGGKEASEPAPEPEARSGAPKVGVAVVSSLLVLVSCAMASLQQ